MIFMAVPIDNGMGAAGVYFGILRYGRGFRDFIQLTLAPVGAFVIFQCSNTPSDVFSS